MKTWLAVIFLLSVSAGAEEPAPSQAPAPKIVSRKEETHKFSSLKLKGALKKPELSYIYKRKGVRAEKIVNVPENFNAEFVQDSSRF
jgi:hypothetical protein